MNDGYLVHNGRSSYLERVPFDGRYDWLAGTADYATVFTQDAAERMAEYQRAQGEATVCVVADPCYPRRVPEIDVDAIHYLIAAKDAA